MKAMLYISASVGGLIGGFVPTFWGVDPFGLESILGGFIGGLAGIAAAYYAGKAFDF